MQTITKYKHPEFYSHYAIKNIINNNIYSDKFLLNVLDLNHPELATEEDIACGLQYWAQLFKAKTWEELHMLSSEYEVFEDITYSVEQALSDKKIRMECEARERYERDRISLYASGRKEGEDLMAQLVNLLLNDDRTEDIKRITQDSAYRILLYKEYGLLKQ